MPFGAPLERSALESALQEETPASIYFHIPFCRTLCYFCACHKVIPKDASVSRPFLDAQVCRIGTARREHAAGRRIDR